MMPVDGERKPATQTHLRLQLAQFVTTQPAQVVDSVRGGFCHVGLERVDFAFFRSHHDLADATVRDAMLRAVIVQLMFACHAQTRLERTWRVVDPGVYYLRVARAGVGADALGCFQHDHFAAGQCQRAGYGEAHDSGSDYNAFHALGHERGGRPLRAESVGIVFA